MFSGSAIGQGYAGDRAAPLQLPGVPDAAPAGFAGSGVRCSRVVFNDGLRARQSARANGHKYLSDRDLSTRLITQAKATPERAWLSKVSSVVLQQAWRT